MATKRIMDIMGMLVVATAADRHRNINVWHSNLFSHIVFDIRNIHTHTFLITYAHADAVSLLHRNWIEVKDL